MKKRLSLCLILVLLLSFAANPAYAAVSRNTKITGETYIPEVKIEVVVPTSGNVYINPKRLPVKIGADVVDNQIVSDTFCIENLSEVPVSVNVDVSAKVKSGSSLRLVSGSTADLVATTKKAFMYFEIQAVSDPEYVSWADAFDENKHVVVRETTRSKKNVTVLGANDESRHYGAFRLAGDCIEDPKGGWTSKDGVNVNVVFTFTPRPVGTEIP